MCEAALMQNKLSDASEGEDDMLYGDLGNGFKKHSDLYEREGFHKYTVRPRSGSARKSLPSNGEEYEAVFFHCSKCNSLNDVPVRKIGMNGFVHCKQQASPESNSEASNEELQQRLQEILEEVEILRVELEASQRQLEGKEQALKILQSMAVLDKATSHTKAVFIKTEQQRRSLEKEINVLQWEIRINQEKLKNVDETWAEKYERIYCENAAFKETLKLKTEEIKLLKSENQLLEQQHLEMIAMLDVKQQKFVQDNMSLSKSGVTEVTGLELAVLGACACNGPEGEPCSCAKMSAATRKQLLQLKQEFELLKKSKEEAYIMADAFRIAFEQQLMRRKDQAFRLAQMSKICRKETKTAKWKSTKEYEKRKSLGEKLMGMLASGTDSKTVEELDNPLEIIRMLIDLLNDKEEILAHQRKVSYMLARALEDKEDTLQQKKENTFSEEKFTFKNNQCKKELKPQERIFPECSCCQTYPAQDGFSLASNTYPSRMPSSHSMGSKETKHHNFKETANTK
ncbi:coiled-coil domain-containing protein 125 [Python bivittatus]|uniref:Coiled-coil domain-containing protein 125 n=1 Tax=Python bivittatus TaxID=176946 RepID=A0A9F5MTU9_PYTBI|nr:coiled-coil domain-containing protein 125 [Python bivittatus]XP_025025954.1 coiled-coil domain-containing protein 125 [Python bivittatus]XP_025025955.1 coiled-coil domain-containing protein 125 [Python bivittatus]